MPQTLADKLKSARQQRFVGRSYELASFESAITAAELPFYVMHLFGPGGVGKSTLLNEFASLAESRGVRVIHLDGRNIDPSPDSFMLALQSSFGISTSGLPLEIFIEGNQRTVLLIDTYEKLAPLDDWFREVFLLQIPESVLTVFAGRNAPSVGWRIDSGWQTLVRTFPLRNLSPEESRTYLNHRHVPEQQHETVLEFTRGHPLALSLVADTMDQRPESQFTIERNPDIVKTLLERLVEKVPDKLQRTALEVCALVHVTTESLLAKMLGVNDVHSLFQWLSRLSFIETGSTGLFPHDLVRDALIVELRWRNPDAYAELHHRAREYYKKRIQQTQGEDQRLILIEYVYLHRLNPVIQPAIEWQEHGTMWRDSARESDIPKLLEMIARHEGKESAKIAEPYLVRSISNPSVVVTVLRDAQKEPTGFFVLLFLNEITKDDEARDPAVRSVLKYLRTHAPLRSNERAIFFRYWMAKEQYQDFSSIQSGIFTNVFQYYFSTPALAFSFFPASNPQQWTPLFSYAEINAIEDADFEVGVKKYAMFGHDWRTMPISQWLEVLGQKEMGMTAVIPASKREEQIIVLSETSFASAVSEALWEYSSSGVMKSNPLLQSRLVVSKAGNNASLEERADVLRSLVKEACEQLQSSPRESKFYRVIHRTYLNPAVSQELAAEALGIPFSTYRRYLKSGIQRVTEILWQKEINAFEG